MQKIEVTDDIANRLKTIRMKNSIKSKELAEHIEKSAAYITKLEKAEIKNIDKELLKKIINYITSSEDGFEKFFEDYIIEIPANEIDSDIWMMNFDSLERKIPVPKALVNYINEELGRLNVTTTALINYINENEDLNSDFFSKHNLNRNDYELNIWHKYATIEDEQHRVAFFILLNLNVEQLDKILSFELDSCNHMILFAVVYHLLKYDNKLNGQPSDNDTLQSKAINILQQFKFYSLSDRSKLSKQAKTKDEFESLLNDFDKDNMEHITNFLNCVNFLSDYDIKYANEKLKGIVENLEMDCSFALSFMAISLSTLSDINVTQRKKFLDSVRNLINQFNSTNKSESQIELY
jgi:transcriptional regulator with XRE-family HTH domain